MKNKIMMVLIGILFYNSNIVAASINTLPPKKEITSNMSQEEVFNIGDEYFLEGNYEDSLKVFKRNLEDEKFILGAATVSRLLGRYKESVKYYNLLIEKNPENQEGYFGRALSNRGLEEYRKAIKDFKTAIEKGSSEYAYVGIGDLYILIGEKGKAKTILGEGIQQFPNSTLLKQLRKKAYN